MAKDSKRVEFPEWSTSILKLRRQLGLTQSELGSRLHYSAMAVCRWETGKQEPTSQCYIQLGNLAGEPDCWVFWGRAGLNSSDIESIFPGPKAIARMRFMQPSITIHAGETVEWDSSDVTGHTITFGQEPPNVTPATPPSANVSVDPDGARHATISSPSDSVHSGLIAQAGHERTGVQQAPAGVTQFRVTFTNPGTYTYICAFHDQLGMTGEVVVLP